ncbi:MAG: arylsulfatase [Planctomycetaceae bacterium]|nr:arylsulfatase [Planctomycetaceae bacterium]
MIRVLIAILCIASCSSATAADKPNMIFIMADDVGIEGLGCYGGVSYKTPNLDRMAAEGVRFTHAYSQPLCTPTRIQLMTGKYNHRNWRSFGILDPKEKTFGHAISAAGYATAIIGKWQLQSYDPPDFPGANKRRSTGMHPKDGGFDEYALFHALHTEDKGSRYANPTMLEGKTGEEGTLKTYKGRYGEDVWVEKILDFFDRHPDQPRFVYYPMALPHWPFQPTPNSEGWDPSKPQETDLRYAKDMIEYMDTTIGNLLAGLEKRKLADSTVVFFYSDNGTHLKVNSKMKDGRTIDGGKATSRQTGIHVPLIVRCPKYMKPGVSNVMVDASDFFATLLDLAGAKPPDDSRRDGISFSHQLFLLKGRVPKAALSMRNAAFFWYDPRPGWDKERFRREVFVVTRYYKYFRDGRFYRLTDKPLEEIVIADKDMTDRDRKVKELLAKYIEEQMQSAPEPPLVNAFGELLK